MFKTRNGLNILTSALSPPSNNSQTQPMFVAVRVVDIILDKSHPDFERLGGWNSIGTIKYREINEYVSEAIPSNLLSAYPLFANIKNYPLINEVVFIISLPTINSQSKTSNELKYYMTAVNVWNSIQHNALPESFNQVNNKDYKDIINGSTNFSTTDTNELNLGNTFVEKADMSPLLPFEGDFIIEGRFGNSIRFGSTVNKANSWSIGSGVNGDPITILKNGAPYANKDFSFIVEDFNKDSIAVFTTSQEIPIDVVSTNQKSYYSPNNYKPTSPNKYSNPQVILNSGRILLNAREDSVLIFSNKSIGLSTKGSINLDSDKYTILNAPKIYLGLDANKEEEPILLGNKTVVLLKNLFDSITKLSVSLSKMVGVPENGPFTEVNFAAEDLKQTIDELTNQLPGLKSKQNFTI